MNDFLSLSIEVILENSISQSQQGKDRSVVCAWSEIPRLLLLYDERLIILFLHFGLFEGKVAENKTVTVTVTLWAAMERWKNSVMPLKYLFSFFP